MTLTASTHTTSSLSRLLATSALCIAAFGTHVYALPVGGAVQDGTVTINAPVGGSLTVDQTTTRGVINWNSFNINTGEAVHFNQTQGAAAATLNRVTGDINASQIKGQLTALGEVVVVNPNGVVFSADADVDVARLIASSADVGTADYMAGNYNFDAAGAANAKIENHGSLTAADGGIVALIAPKVSNSGVITANKGAVLLAAGETATLDFYGDGLINFATTTIGGHSGGNNAIKQESTGQIKADSGKVYVSANAASSVVSQVVNLEGVVEANSLVAGPNGEIVIAAEGNVKVKAPLNAQNVTVNAGAHNVFVKNITAKTAENTKNASVAVTGAAITVDGNISAKVEGAGEGGGTGNVTLTGAVTETLNGTEQKIEASHDVLIDGTLHAVSSKDDNVPTNEFTSTDQTLGIYGGNSVRATGKLSSMLADIHITGGAGGVNVKDIATGKALDGLVMDQNFGGFAPGSLWITTSDGGAITTGVLSATGTGNPQYQPSTISVSGAGDVLIDAITVLIDDLPDPGTAYTFYTSIYGVNIELLNDIDIHVRDNQGRYRDAGANLSVYAENNATFGGDVKVLSEAGIRFPEDTGYSRASIEIVAGGDLVGNHIGARALGGDYADASVCINACLRDAKVSAEKWLGFPGNNVTLKDVIAIAITSQPEGVDETPPEQPEVFDRVARLGEDGAEGGTYGDRGTSRAQITIFGNQSVTTDDEIAQAYGGYDARAMINTWSGQSTGTYPSGGPTAASFWLDSYGTDLSGGSVTTGNVFAQAITGNLTSDNNVFGYGYYNFALATVDLTAGSAITTGNVTASSWDNYDAVSYVDVESAGTVSVGSLLAEANSYFNQTPYFGEKVSTLFDSGEGGEGGGPVFPMPEYTNAQATVRIVADGTIADNGANITYNGADPRAKANSTNRQGRASDYEASSNAFSQLILVKGNNNPETPTVPGGGGGGGGTDTTPPTPPGATPPGNPGGGTPTQPGGDQGSAPGTGPALSFQILDELLEDFDNGFFRGLYSYYGSTLGNPYYFGNVNVNLTLLANGGGGGGLNPSQLGNLAPAAGGSAEQLGQLAPAAGGNNGQPNNVEDQQCGNNFLDGGFSQQFNAEACNESNQAF